MTKVGKIPSDMQGRDAAKMRFRAKKRNLRPNLLRYDRKNVLLVTDVEFWQCSRGDQLRIFNLCLNLRSFYNVAVFFLGRVDEKAAFILKSRGCRCELADMASWLPKASGKTCMKQYSQPVSLRRWRRDCHAAALAAYLRSKPRFTAVILESARYAWLAGVFDYRLLKILDAHDITARRNALDLPSLAPNLTLVEEKEIFDSMDAVLFVRESEYRTALALGCRSLLLHCPHSVEISPPPEAEKGVNFGIVADQNGLDVVDWFIRNVWIVLPVASAFLHIYGDAGANLKNAPANAILHCGRWRLDDVYKQCQIMISPGMADIGAEIMLSDSLAHGRPVIAFDRSGISENAVSRGVMAAGSRREFMDALIQLTYDSVLRRNLSQMALAWAKDCLSPEVACASLFAAIGGY